MKHQEKNVLPLKGWQQLVGFWCCGCPRAVVIAYRVIAAAYRLKSAWLLLLLGKEFLSLFKRIIKIIAQPEVDSHLVQNMY